jgi:hypothetical protein
LAEVVTYEAAREFFQGICSSLAQDVRAFMA